MLKVIRCCSTAAIVLMSAPSFVQLAQAEEKSMSQEKSMVQERIAPAAADNAPAKSDRSDVRVLAEKIIEQLDASGVKSSTVMDFTDIQGNRTELGRYLAQELSDQLISAAKKTTFVDRGNLQALLKENKLSVEGLVNSETSRKLGNLIGVDAIIFGTATPIGDKIKLSVRAVGVDTGKIMASQTAALPAKDGLADMAFRGVSSNGSEASDGSASSDENSSAGPDNRSKILGESIKLVGREIVLNPDRNTVIAKFKLKNMSGQGIAAAILKTGIAIWNCSSSNSGNNYSIMGSGLPFLDYDSKTLISKEHVEKELGWLPAGADTSISITKEGGCLFKREDAPKKADVSISLVLGIGKTIFEVPLSGEDIPVTVMK